MKKQLLAINLLCLLISSVMSCVTPSAQVKSESSHSTQSSIQESENSKSSQALTDLSFSVNLFTDNSVFLPSEMSISARLFDTGVRVPLEINSKGGEDGKEDTMTKWSADFTLRSVLPQKDSPLRITVNSPFLNEQKYELTFDSIQNGQITLGEFSMDPVTYMEFEWCYSVNNSDELSQRQLGRIADHRNPAGNKELNDRYYVCLMDYHIQKGSITNIL